MLAFGMWPTFYSLLLGLTNSWMVVSVLPKKFYKTLCQTIVSWRFVITKTFHRKNHFLFTDFFVTNFFSSWLKVGSEISQRNSLYSCFVFLSFLSNKFSKKLSNSLLISTELSISLLSIFNLVKYIKEIHCMHVSFF